MSTLIRFPVTHENIAGYCFGSAELQIGAERLLVAGEEVALSSMAYRFLLGLCRAHGALLTRAEAFDLLWPGGGAGSDEGLAQVVLKTRQALGEDGKAVVTVRGRGFRLDLPVETLSARPLANVAPAHVQTVQSPQSIPAAPHDPPEPALRRRVAKKWLFAGAATAALVAAVFWPAAPNVELDGYALDAHAFGPISATGADALRTALIREDEGDRTSARQLVSALIDSEPHSAAPAFLLQLWHNGSVEERQKRQSLLQDRLPKGSSAYVQLLVRWVGIIDNVPGTENEILNAALKLEPAAWRLHLDRAHIMLRLLRFDAALADLRAAPIDAVAPRFAMFIMSDRASLGDADAMRAQLPQLAARAPAVADYVRGRIALAQKNWEEAQSAFEAAADRADREALTGAVTSSWVLAAVAAAAQERWERVESDADRAYHIGLDHKVGVLVDEANALTAYARYRRGLVEQSEADWERAGITLREHGDREEDARLWLQRARMQPIGASAHPPPYVDDGEDPGLTALLAARRAWLACDADGAMHSLDASASAGIDAGYFADEAELLRQDLGLARRAAAAPPLLPYPALARWISYWESSRAAGARTCDLIATVGAQSRTQQTHLLKGAIKVSR